MFTPPEWLKWAFNVLTGLFIWLGLRKNVREMVGIVLHTCHIIGRHYNKSYMLRMMGGGGATRPTRDSASSDWTVWRTWYQGCWRCTRICNTELAAASPGGPIPQQTPLGPARGKPPRVQQGPGGRTRDSKGGEHSHRNGGRCRHAERGVETSGVGCWVAGVGNVHMGGDLHQERMW